MPLIHRYVKIINRKLFIDFVISSLMVHGYCTLLKDQAQYALCDWCKFERITNTIFFSFNFVLECELCELLLFLLSTVRRPLYLGI